MNDEAWNSYPARVDDAPASFLVAMHFESGERPPGAETLYVAGLGMVEPGEHGMGTNAEAESFAAIQDAIAHELTKAGFVAVGRLRNKDTWQLSYYGPNAGKELFLAALKQHGSDLDRELWTHIDHDPDWNYFTTFLMPDPERRQWMRNAQVVDQLVSHGDQLERERMVDHWLYFPSLEGLQSFRRLAVEHGFCASEESPEQQANGTYPLKLSREDGVELSSIHRVVMALVLLSEPHGAEYDGWEAPIVRTG